jgi:hypothetical protein
LSKNNESCATPCLQRGVGSDFFAGLKPKIHKEIQRDFLCFYQRGFGELVISEIEIALSETICNWCVITECS